MFQQYINIETENTPRTKIQFKNKIDMNKKIIKK